MASNKIIETSSLNSLMINPTSNSNWIINNVLLGGGVPQTQGDVEALVQAGIDTIVCLQTPSETKECKLDLSAFERYTFPIVDGRTANDDALVKWCHAIIDLLYRGRKVYLHCYGGHGRTGTMAACVLQLLGMKATEALQYIDLVHSTRLKGHCVPSPTTKEQIEQCQRFTEIPYTVLVCGDREWTDTSIILRELRRLGPNVTVVQGGCRGADLCAKQVCDDLQLQCITVNAEWDAHGKAAGPIRNQKMIEEYDVILVLAFHADIASSKGTKDTLQRAQSRSIFTRIIID